MDTAAAFKCNGYGLECLLAQQLRQKAVYTGGGLVCKCKVEDTWEYNLYLGVQFIHLSLKVSDQK